MEIIFTASNKNSDSPIVDTGHSQLKNPYAAVIILEYFHLKNTFMCLIFILINDT